MNEPSSVRVERSGSVATVFLDRPEKLNALDRATLIRLGEAFGALRSEAEVRAVLVTGVGDRAFAAGADLGELSELDPAQALEQSRLGQAVFREIESFPGPVVAAVQGHALGGGCELAMACHLRVASESAHFGLPEVRLGLVPGYGGTVRLPRLVGTGSALHLILTGATIGAERAREIGLVQEVVPAAELLDRAGSLLERILANGPLAVRAALDLVRRSFEGTSEGAFAFEAEVFGRLASTSDAREGIQAFLEKRSPRFDGS